MRSQTNKTRNELRRSKRAVLSLVACVAFMLGLTGAFTLDRSGVINEIFPVDAQAAEPTNPATAPTGVTPVKLEPVILPASAPSPVPIPEPQEKPVELPQTVIMFNAVTGIITADGEEFPDEIAGFVYATEELEVYSSRDFDGEPIYVLDEKETAKVLKTYFEGPISGDDLKEMLSGGDSFLTATKEMSIIYEVEVNGEKGYILAWKTAVLDGIFVLVDISEQHLWLIDGNKVLLDTDVVTGNVSKRWSTRLGVFEIKKKQLKATLMQNSKVDYWMPFDGGIGLHDASWRKNFGGEIYLTNGSHGCVNIPPAVTGEIYDTVSVGTTVVVQK